MANVIVDPLIYRRAHIDYGAYINALHHVKMYHPHGNNLSNSTDVALQIAQGMHDYLKVYNKRAEQNPGFGLYNSGKVARGIFFTDKCKIRLMKEGQKINGGYCVLNGELIGFWCTIKGSGTWLLDQAISDGAKHLNCFDGFLVDFYKARGFVEVERKLNWTEGGPQVVYMEIKPCDS